MVFYCDTSAKELSRETDVGAFLGTNAQICRDLHDTNTDVYVGVSAHTLNRKNCACANNSFFRDVIVRPRRSVSAHAHSLKHCVCAHARAQMCVRVCEVLWACIRALVCEYGCVRHRAEKVKGRDQVGLPKSPPTLAHVESILKAAQGHLKYSCGSTKQIAQSIFSEVDSCRRAHEVMLQEGDEGSKVSDSR